MARPTRRAVGMIAGAILLFVIGTNIQSGWLFAMSAMMLGAVIVGLLLPRRMVRGLEVERRAPAEAHAGEDVGVDLIVHNPSPRSRLSISIRDPHIAPFTAFVPALGPGETVVVGTQRRAARRGVIDGQPVLAGSAAPFGVGRAVRRIEAPGRTVIFPRVVPVGWLPELASAAKPLQASTIHARKGTGHDFIGIREYRPGDSMRHVHWPSTARHAGLMVREFEQELPRRTGILVDTAGDVGGAESVLDVACSCAASMAVHALDAGHPVALAAAVEGRLSLADGDPTEALTFLARLAAPGGMDVATVIAAAAPMLGRLDTLVVVLPTWAHDDGPALLSALAGYEGLQVVAVLIETAGAEGRPIGARPMQPADVERVARELASADVTVFRVPLGADLAACLEAPWAA